MAKLVLLLQKHETRHQDGPGAVKGRLGVQESSMPAAVWAQGREARSGGRRTATGSGRDVPERVPGQQGQGESTERRDANQQGVVESRGGWNRC